MNKQEFAKMVSTLRNPIPKGLKDNLYYNVGGLSADVGEIFDAMKDYFWYEKIDLDTFRLNMAEELSDSLHWLQAVAIVMGFSLDQMMDVNKAKLSVRYPNGFTRQCAVVRDKVAEQEAMLAVLEENQDEQETEQP